MMTEKELGLYRELDDKFYAICDAYCQEMGRYDTRYRHLNRFILDGPNVIVSGCDHGKEYEGHISLVEIFKPIEDIKKKVDDLIEAENEKEMDRRKRIEEKKLKDEFEMYEMLKRKFEKDEMSQLDIQTDFQEEI